MEKNLKNNSPKLKTLAVIDGGGFCYNISWKCDALFRIHFIENGKDAFVENLSALKSMNVLKSESIYAPINVIKYSYSF